MLSFKMKQRNSLKVLILISEFTGQVGGTSVLLAPNYANHTLTVANTRQNVHWATSALLDGLGCSVAIVLTSTKCTFSTNAYCF